MVSRDLCQDKKFPDLEDDFFITYDKKKRMSFIDEKNNVWMEGKKISEGGHGKVIDFISHNKEYTDLAVKFFISENREDYLLDMEEETEAVNFFNLYKCKNFLKMGVKAINNEDSIIIMEKIDGDLIHFDFSNYHEPNKVYNDIVDFITSSYKCALKGNKYYTDIKEENIGYKLCKDGPVFTFLDFGSFFDTDKTNIVSTYNINKDAFNKGLISNDLIVVFGTIITLLGLKLLMKSKRCNEKFKSFTSELSYNNNYYSSSPCLLDNKVASDIITYYYDLNKADEDPFTETLLDILFNLTSRQIFVSDFIEMLEFSGK
tara:strand:+ start:33136 stop:34086 length:951 start_codon:yes stop_codon:yes gene_type:complete